MWSLWDFMEKPLQLQEESTLMDPVALSSAFAVQLKKQEATTTTETG